jgi:hypothetical protein
MFNKKQMMSGWGLVVWISAVMDFLVYGLLKQILLQGSCSFISYQSQLADAHRWFMAHSQTVG